MRSVFTTRLTSASTSMTPATNTTDHPRGFVSLDVLPSLAGAPSTTDCWPEPPSIPGTAACRRRISRSPSPQSNSVKGMAGRVSTATLVPPIVGVSLTVIRSPHENALPCTDASIASFVLVISCARGDCAISFSSRSRTTSTGADAVQRAVERAARVLTSSMGSFNPLSGAEDSHPIRPSVFCCRSATEARPGAETGVLLDGVSRCCHCRRPIGHRTPWQLIGAPTSAGQSRPFRLTLLQRTTP